MKSLIRTVLSFTLAWLPFGAVAQASAEEPIITFHTDVYGISGAENIFTFYLGSTENTYVDTDCGFGTFETEIEGAVFDYDNGKIQGTAVTCTVSADGIVKIYGDASKIDFIDMEGCYITDIQWPQMTEVAILNLNHNQLSGLDLSHMKKLQAFYVNDNPFSEATPLVVGSDKPQLTIVEMSIVDWLDPSFNIGDYPALRSFTAYSCPTLRHADTTNCPDLLQLSIDGSSVSSVDVSHNPNLLILNVSETKVTELDLSHNPYLTELYCQHEAATNQDFKIKSLDLSNNPEIQRLYVNGNLLTSLDLSNMPKLTSFGCKRNKIKELSFDNNPVITLIDISLNDMTFTTMPEPRTTFSDYVYYQNPMPLSRSYVEGTVLDFTEAVMRADSNTDAVVYSTDPRAGGDDAILGDDYYTWDNGRLTLLKECGDSVYVAFKNTMFPDCILRTSAFMVKNAADFGQPVPAVSMRLSVLAKEPKMSVGIAGATPEAPVPFSVDFGDGNRQTFYATSATIPSEPNVSGTRAGSTATIYVNEGCDLTALSVDGVRLYTLDVSQAPALAWLSASDCALPAVSLQWNNMLRYLDLSKNSLKTLDLTEPNENFMKTRLAYIDVSDNALTSFRYNMSFHPSTLKAARNKLETLDLTHAYYISYIDFSDNLIDEISLIDCESLQYLNVAGNRLTEITLPDYTPLQTLDLSRNSFSLLTLPLPGKIADYVYAPQAALQLPSKAPSVNLTSQLLDVDGQTTAFKWFMAETDTPVAEGNILETKPGRFRFSNPATGDVYCTVSHPAFPELSGENVLRTTVVTTADTPTNAIASFVPSQDAEGTIGLAALTNGTSIYADVTGDGDLEQYILATNAVHFPIAVTAGVSVKLYSYDETNDISVISLNGLPLESADFSQLTAAFHVGVSGSHIKLENLSLPSGGALREFVANDCGLSDISFDKLENLTFLSLSNNEFTTLDVTPLKKLGNLYAAGNCLTEVKLDNPLLWEASLINNQIERLDLAGVPEMQQLWLSHNSLHSLDVSSLSKLRVLTIDNNAFDFTTLPAVSQSYFLYNYADQQPITVQPDGGCVDLSSQAMVGTIPTQYTWYIDSPYFDESGNLIGEDLYVDEEYLLENGVTTFLKPFNHIMCVMTNAAFPNLYLYTDFIDVEAAAGIEDITVDAGTESRYYNIQGQPIKNPIPGQLYIRRTGDKVEKIIQP